MQMIFFLLCFVLHLVVGYAKPCWRDGDARISNAAVCQYGRNDYCCCHVFKLKLNTTPEYLIIML